MTIYPDQTYSRVYAMEKWLSDFRKFYVIYNKENVNVACFGHISSEVTFIDDILIKDFEKVRNDVIIAIVYKR